MTMEENTMEEENTMSEPEVVGDNGSPPKTRRVGRPKGSKNKRTELPKKRKSRQQLVYKLSDGTVLPPPDQLPAAYLFECAVYANELRNKLPQRDG